MEKQIQTDFRRNFYTNDDSGKIYIISLLAPFLVMLLFSMLGVSIATAAGLSSENMQEYLWFTIPYAFAGQLTFLATFFIYNKMAKVKNSAVGLNFKIGWKRTLIAIAVGIVALFGIQYFISLCDMALVAVGYPMQDNISILPLNNFGWYILNLFVLALLPAICEELIFRGVVLKGLRRNFSDITAVLLSALMFCLMHGNLQQFAYTFLLGVVLGWIATRTGSIFSSMIVHFVNNFIVITLAFIEEMTSWSMYIDFSWWFVLVALLLLCVTGVIIFLIDMFFFKHKNDVEEEKEREKRPSLFLIISLAVGVVLLILMTIMNFMPDGSV